ncbi:MAG TPA: hypothetical protein H9695_13890, partial [Candidatus Mediterraneibacter excrementigallinarum]|nr:hypothetical protein [Candidatus Mediterraneibacter excrementigallinarum]
KSKIAGLGKVRPFLGKTSKNLLIFIHFSLDISPLDFSLLYPAKIFLWTFPVYMNREKPSLT